MNVRDLCLGITNLITRFQQNLHKSRHHWDSFSEILNKLECRSGIAVKSNIGNYVADFQCHQEVPAAFKIGRKYSSNFHVNATSKIGQNSLTIFVIAVMKKLSLRHNNQICRLFYIVATLYPKKKKSDFLPLQFLRISKNSNPSKPRSISIISQNLVFKKFSFKKYR